MKKILFLLLLTIYGLQAQTYQNPTYGTLTLKTSPTVNAHPYLTTTESNGVQSKVVSVMNQNANTGLLSGGVISVNADPTKWNLAFGEGYVADPLNGTVAKVAWGTQSALTTPYLTTSTATYVLIANAGGGIGSVVMQNTYPTNEQFRTHVYLGKLAHTTFTTILFAVPEPSRMYHVAQDLHDFINAFRPLNIEGNTITPNGANLNINVSAGKMYREGANYANNRNDPSTTSEPAVNATSFRDKFRNGSGGWTAINTSTLSANFWDNNSGILQAVDNNKWTVRPVNRFGGTGTIHIDYGQAMYANKVDAVASISKALVYEDPDTRDGASRIGWWVLKQGITALNDVNTAEFVPADMFGNRSTAISTGTLKSAYDNSVTPQITTTASGGALAIKQGSGSDTDNILVGQNGSGTNTFAVNGNGEIYTAATPTATAFSHYFGETASDGVIRPKTLANVKTEIVTTASVDAAKPNIVTGSLTSGYIPKATGGNTTSDSAIYQDSNNNIGIGTTTPNFISGLKNVTIDGVIGSEYLNRYNGVDALRFRTTSTGSSISEARASTPINFQIGSTNVLRLDGSTNVLIGTTTDNGNKLNLNGTAYLGNTVTLGTTPTTSAGSYDILTRNSSTGVVEKVASSLFSSNWTASGSDLYNTSAGKVSIGVTSVPTTSTLRIRNTISGDTNKVLSIENNAGTEKAYIAGQGNIYSSGYIYGGNIVLNNSGDWFGNASGSLRLTNSGGARWVTNSPITLKSYTVATLPVGVQGDTAYVTDATAPTYLGTLTGGGSVVCPVFYNGTAWVSH